MPARHPIARDRVTVRLPGILPRRRRLEIPRFEVWVARVGIAPAQLAAKSAKLPAVPAGTLEPADYGGEGLAGFQ